MTPAQSMPRPFQNYFFWLLPHETRRYLFKKIYPELFGALQQKRKLEVHGNFGSYKGFDDKRCIFVHVPKAAGVSINLALFNNLGGAHSSIKKYALIFSESEFQSYYKFSIVRNPYDRLYSAFTFLKGGGLNDHDRCWAEKNLSDVQDFSTFVLSWLNKKRLYSWVHFVPQFEFLLINGRIMVDDFFKIEEINNAVRKIGDMTKTEIGVLPKHNETNARTSTPEYNLAVIRKINSLYRRDFKLFNYEML